jgi:hypothetical protein
MENLAKAVNAVMNEVKGIDKSLVVGSGAMSYKGVPDQEVKKVIGQAMQKHGLVMLPVAIEPSVHTSEWEETTNYGVKRKQSVFTEVRTKYLLLHTSGESIEVCGYGHGVDSQDKGAGKATTYALKYALLYMFMVPTGKIDDADTTHSEEIATPQAKQKAPEKAVKKKSKIPNERFDKAVALIDAGEYTEKALLATFELTPEQQEKLSNRKTESKDEQEQVSE